MSRRQRCIREREPHDRLHHDTHHNPRRHPDGHTWRVAFAWNNSHHFAIARDNDNRLAATRDRHHRTRRHEHAGRIADRNQDLRSASDRHDGPGHGNTAAGHGNARAPDPNTTPAHQHSGATHTGAAA